MFPTLSTSPIRGVVLVITGSTWLNLLALDLTSNMSIVVAKAVKQSPRLGITPSLGDHFLIPPPCQSLKIRLFIQRVEQLGIE